MKLVWGVLPLVSLCFVAQASESGVTFLETLKMSPSIEEVTTNNADTCADFSGSWKGTCQASGVKKEEAFAVKQAGCVAIEIEASNNKMMIPVGGVMSGSGAIPGSPGVVFGGSIESHWNADKTELSLHAMGGGKKLELSGQPSGAAFSEKVYLKAGKLYADIFAAGNHKMMVAFCEFEKVN